MFPPSSPHQHVCSGATEGFRWFLWEDQGARHYNNVFCWIHCKSVSSSVLATEGKSGSDFKMIKSLFVLKKIQPALQATFAPSAKCIQVTTFNEKSMQMHVNMHFGLPLSEPMFTCSYVHFVDIFGLYVQNA